MSATARTVPAIGRGAPVLASVALVTMFGAPWIESLSFTVPTPGALALLGTAGLLRTRRRRR